LLFYGGVANVASVFRPNVVDAVAVTRVSAVGVVATSIIIERLKQKDLDPDQCM